MKIVFAVGQPLVEDAIEIISSNEKSRTIVELVMTPELAETIAIMQRENPGEQLVVVFHGSCSRGKSEA